MLLATDTRPAAELDLALRRYVEHADPEAFQRILIAYHRLARAVCARILGDPAAVDDAVQETFIRLARHAASIRTNLGSWIYQTATNAALSLRRGEIARHRREHRWAAERDEDAAAVAPPGEHEFLIEQCVAELDDEGRRLITAYFFHGRTQRDLAEELGISQPAVKKRLDRTLLILRLKLLRRGVLGGPAGEGAAASYAAGIPLDHMPVALVALVLAVGLAIPSARAGVVARIRDVVLRIGGSVAAMLRLSCRGERRCRFAAA